MKKKLNEIKVFELVDVLRDTDHIIIESHMHTYYEGTLENLLNDLNKFDKVKTKDVRLVTTFDDTLVVYIYE